MSSCGKQEEVQIKVKFKPTFRVLFFEHNCHVLFRMFLVMVQLLKVFEKMQEVSQSIVHAGLGEFHDNLDWLVVVCPGVYTSILTAQTVIAQVDAQLNPNRRR